MATNDTAPNDTPIDYEALVRELAKSAGVDPDIAARIMRTESAGNAQARSAKGAQGLMQLMPATAAQYGVTDPLDPAQNIAAGITHLKHLQDKYPGNPLLQVAAYNAGEGAVDKAGGVPPFKETQDYVRKVLPQAFSEQGTQSAPVAQTSGLPSKAEWSAAPGNIWNAIKNPENFSTEGGVVGGSVGAALGGPPGAIGGAALGGGIGNVLKQYLQGGQVDPIEPLVEGTKQGFWEGLGTVPGALLRKTGASLYSSGAGLSRVGLKKDIPQGLQEGLEGGRFTLPIFTAGGVDRVMGRNMDKRQALYDAAQAAGKGDISPVEIARKGMPQIYAEARTGSDVPKTELHDMGQRVRDFIEQHSQVTPGRNVPPMTVQQATAAIDAQGAPITQSVQLPGFSVPPRITPNKLSIDEVSALKTGTGTRANRAFRADQAGNVPPTGARATEGIAIGAQKALEDRIPQLQGVNRSLQGDIGLKRGINPTGLSEEDWRSLGISPEVAAVIMSNGNKGGGNLLSQVIKGLPAAAATTGAASMGAGALGAGAIGLSTLMATHAVTSPLGKRLIGGSAFTAGRALPGVVRGAHALGASEEPDPQKTALLKALLGVQ